MSKIIWQPKSVYQPSYEFSISLDRTFAKEMLAARISQGTQKRMNELALETLIGLGFNWPGPLTFHEDTGLVTQFYISKGGVWLAMDGTDKHSLLGREDKNKLIEYDSHNVDNSSQAYALMALVDRWVEYSDVMRNP